MRIPVRTNELLITQPLCNQRVVVGSQNNMEATLPLNAAEAFLATDTQRRDLAQAAFRQIVLEASLLGEELNFDEVRTEIKNRTGVGDTAATLALMPYFDPSRESLLSF